MKASLLAAVASISVGAVAVHAQTKADEPAVPTTPAVGASPTPDAGGRTGADSARPEKLPVEARPVSGVQIASAARAPALRFGVEGSAVLTIPKFGASPALDIGTMASSSDSTSASISVDGQSGMGGRIALTAQYGFGNRFGAIGSIGYMYCTFGAKVPISVSTTSKNGEEDNTFSETEDIAAHFLSSDIALTYAVRPNVLLVSGLGVDVPLYTSADPSSKISISGYKLTKTKLDGIVQNSSNLQLGTDFAVNPDLALQARVKIPTSSFIDLIVLKCSLYQVALGASYLF